MGKLALLLHGDLGQRPKTEMFHVLAAVNELFFFYIWLV
jgi:hypothetical protein